MKRILTLFTLLGTICLVVIAVFFIAQSPSESSGQQSAVVSERSADEYRPCRVWEQSGTLRPPCYYTAEIVCLRLQIRLLKYRLRFLKTRAEKKIETIALQKKLTECKRRLLTAEKGLRAAKEKRAYKRRAKRIIPPSDAF